MRRHLATTLLSLCLASAALLTQAAEAPKPTAAPDAPDAPEPAIAGSQPAAPGMTVYKDPDTGRLLPAPADELQKLLTQDLRNALSTSHEGLIETAAPGGGVMVDLRGRFKSLTWASIGPDGKVVTHCESSEPPAPHHPSQAPKE